MGTLYLVATPIGNLEDVTRRAVRVLSEVTRVLAEDTRRTVVLMDHLGLRVPLVSLHEHNEAGRTDQALAWLGEGENLALVSDAGTPLISDPGERLVRAAAEAGHEVVPLPGPSAVLSALVSSGLASGSFVFLGFPPRKGEERSQLLDRVAGSEETVVLFESPERLDSLFADLAPACGEERRVAVARELTKVHEEVFRGTLAEAVLYYERTPPRGEVTVVIESSPERGPPDAVDQEVARTLARTLVHEGLRPSHAAREVARRLGLPRNLAYEIVQGLGREWTAAAEGHGRVTEAVDAVRLHLRRRAALAGVLWGAAGFGAVLVLAWWLAGPDGWRQGSAVPLLLDLSLLLLASCLALVLGRGRCRWPAESPVVREMEYSAGLDTGEVEGVLQLARAVPAGVSASLAALAERGVVGRLDLPESRLSGALGVQARLWVRRGGAILAMVAPMTVLLLVSSPARSMGAWSGLGRPLSLIARPELPPIQVAPGDVEVSRGSPLTVTVSAPGRAEVTLRWQGAGDVARTETKATEGLEVGFRFPSVRVEIEYSVTTPDGAQSPRFLISPVDPLLVSDVTVALTFPPHTGRAPEEYRGETPPLVIPVGTRLGLEGQATRPLSEARLEREEDGLGVPLEVAGLGFSGDWLPRDGGRYQWRFLDSDGKAAEIVPPPLEVTVVPDSAPAVPLCVSCRGHGAPTQPAPAAGDRGSG